MDSSELSNQFLFIDKVPVGILVIDANFKLLEWNQILVSWSGISKQDAIGKSILELYPGLNEKRYKIRLEGVLNGGPPTVFSPQLHHHFLPIQLKDGSLAVQQTTVSPIVIDQGLKGAMICIQDVTDLSKRVISVKSMRDQALEEIRQRKIAEEKLERLNEEFKAFSQRVAHDLRGPLGMAVNLADLGLVSHADDEEARELFERIKTSSAYGLRMIEGLYKLSGLTASEVGFAPISLNEMIPQVLEQLEASLKSSALEVKVDCSDIFEGSSELFPQILQNFISNTLKYCTGESPSLKIYTMDKGDEVEKKKPDILKSEDWVEWEKSIVHYLRAGLCNNVRVNRLFCHKSKNELFILWTNANTQYM